MAWDEHYHVILRVSPVKRKQSTGKYVATTNGWLKEVLKPVMVIMLRYYEFDPKIWATGGPCCPYDILSEFLNRRCQSMKKPDSPLYLSVIDNPSKKDVWYKDQRLGIKKLHSMLKDMAKSVWNL